jgi:AmmeMemoRadiSam system protein A
MPPLSESQQQLLLRLARQALEECVRNPAAGGAPDIDPQDGALLERRGVFVTLHKSGRLRGCIGNIEPSKPLYQTVCECARSAALRDPRFDPVQPEELPQLHVEISVLSPMEDIRPEQVEVGRHGLLISRGFRRGLLLPQVASEFNWDRKEFLEETCLKAGLPPDAWEQGARIQAFTAQVFGEPRGAARSSPTAA